jgi:hypothetical protein
MDNFIEYYDELIEKAENNIKMLDNNDQAILYVYIKIQMLIFRHIFEEGYDLVNDSFVFIQENNHEAINKMNENNLLELCESAKEINYLNNTLVNYFIVPNLNKIENINHVLNLGLNKYFELDTSLSNEEKDYYKKELFSKAINDFKKLNL